MSIPTMILFKNGSEIDRIIGVVPEEAVTDFATQ
jgi:thioredoxin-like negative regulator of GroEL